MAEMSDLKRRLGLMKGPVVDEDHDPKLVALAEYDAALKDLVLREEAYLEIQREQQTLMEPLQKRFQEATRKLQMALLGKEDK
jgi:hypothetical protein